MVLPIDIILVRHGESEGNIAMKRGRGGDRSVFKNENFAKKHSSLYRLTTSGINQAKAAGEWIRENIGLIDEFYVSEYIRAMETAAYLEIPNSKWIVDFMLRERDWGSKEYKSYEERLQFRSSVQKRMDEFFFVPSRGESLARVCSRLMKIITELHNKSDRKVLIVCHDKVIRCFRVLLENIGQEKYRELSKDFDNTESPNCINKCQIFHYTRRNPFTGHLSSELKFMRSMNPWDKMSPSNTGWIKIEDIKKKLRTEDLFERVYAIPRILDNNSPANLPPDYSNEPFSIPSKYEADIEEEYESDDSRGLRSTSSDDNLDDAIRGLTRSTSSDDNLDETIRGESNFIKIGEEIEQIIEEDDSQTEDDDDEGEGEEGGEKKVAKKKKKKKKKKTTRKFIRLDPSIVNRIVRNIKKSGWKKKKKKKKKKKEDGETEEGGEEGEEKKEKRKMFRQ